MVARLNYDQIGRWLLKYRWHAVCTTAAIIAIVANAIVLRVPVFADGSQHTWLTRYACSEGVLPTEDITGTQPSYLRIHRSITTPEPMIYQPLFYYMSGSLCAISGSPVVSIDTINILSIIAASTFIALLAIRLANRKIAATVFCLICVANFWTWLAVHRLAEGLIIALACAIFFSLYRYMTGNRQYLFVTMIELVALFGVKQSVYPIVATVFVGILLKSRKDFFVWLPIFLVAVAPFYYFNFTRFKALTPIPTGVSVVDSAFSQAWWNQEPAAWDKQLDIDSNDQAIRDKSASVFKSDIRRTPQNLYRETGTLGILNQFSIYPISKLKTEGYHSGIADKIEPLFLLLTFLGVIICALRWRNVKQGKIAIAASFLYFTVVIMWLIQPVFRYYMYVIPISAIFIAVSLEYITKKHRRIGVLLVCLVVMATLYNLYNEVKRDLSYRHTAMHRMLPTADGGLDDSISFGKYVQAQDNHAKYIFTPMVEIAYYTNERYMWDDRLFFIDDKQKLIDYMKHYEFNYVVLPFYAGTTRKDNWVYYQGPPADSTFYDVLNDQQYFRVVTKNNTFTAYERLQQ